MVTKLSKDKEDRPTRPNLPGGSVFKASTWAIVGMLILGLIVVLFVAFAYDRVGG
jgi:hypothetical protein